MALKTGLPTTAVWDPIKQLVSVSTYYQHVLLLCVLPFKFLTLSISYFCILTGIFFEPQTEKIGVWRLIKSGIRKFPDIAYPLSLGSVTRSEHTISTKEVIRHIFLFPFPVKLLPLFTSFLFAFETFLRKFLISFFLVLCPTLPRSIYF